VADFLAEVDMREEQIREAGERLIEAGKMLSDLSGHSGPKDVKDLNSELDDVGKAVVAAGEALTRAIGQG
jgi:hypothetical protein